MNQLLNLISRLVCCFVFGMVCVSSAVAQSIVSDAPKSTPPVASNIGCSPDVKNKLKSPLPSPVGFVSDFAQVMTAPTKARLEKTLAEFAKKSDIEFAVVTVRTTEDVSIFDYSLAVACGWGIGKAPEYKGLLMLVAIKDRRWRIQISRKLETDLPNDVAAALGNLTQPFFQQNQYGEGLTLFVDKTIEQFNKQNVSH